ARRAAWTAPLLRRFFYFLTLNHSLTVPLLCSAVWGRFQPERLHQIQRRLPQRPAVNRRPQVDHIPLLPAALVETMEDVLVEVDAEGAAPRIAPMQRTGTAPLWTPAAQSPRQAQVVQHGRQRQLPFQMGKINEKALANRRRF